MLAPLAPALAQNAGPTDPQIAHIAYTAGQLDIDAAKQALEKSTNPQVRAFAETMQRDHAAVNQQALALVTRLHVTPEANPTSASLSDAAAATRQRLAGLSGAAATSDLPGGASTMTPPNERMDMGVLLSPLVSLYGCMRAGKPCPMKNNF